MQEQESAAARPEPGAAPSLPEPTVVGIGASAGGLAALKALFAHVPEDSGLAFVVVVHLSPDHESHLADVLQPHVRMPVTQVTETVPLEADHVYLIPPNANLEAIDTHLRLSALETRREERAPVDHFFRTLARAHDGRAVGVILSGTGSDGALGIRAITERGGLTVVQTPDEAEYDGMPRSAIATGVVDLVLPVAQIPAAVIRFARTAPRLASSEDEEEVGGETRAMLRKIFALIRARAGQDFTRYKRSTMQRRIARRMQLHHLEELAAYLEMLRSQPEEVRALADDLLITVTSFFRDPQVYEKLQTDVLPRIFARKGDGDREVRAWSVGCATGEEAYSLAILLIEEAARHESPPRIQVFASDLHEDSLERARAGLYPGDVEGDVSRERLHRFFVKEAGGYRIRREVRERVVFARHDLLGDPPFSRLDLVCCRNLLIYLERNAQQEVDELFHYALRPEGFLVVGGSETVVRSDLFLPEDRKACIYRRRDVPTPEPRLPVFPSQRQKPRGSGGEVDAPSPVSHGELHQRIVERYAPPSVLVGADDRVVHLSENAGRYLLHSGGELTASIYKLVRDELQIELRATLPQARRAGGPKRTRPVQLRIDGQERCVALDVRPSREPEEAGFVLVIFEEWDSENDAPDRTEDGPDEMRAHERELEVAIELQGQRLQSIIEQYEAGQEEMKASNEELQSANEELRSTLEELETSKEELHSMNEELQTVNQENRHKVEELSQLSGDLQNLLAATDIATLFLDRDFRIMRFTPKAAELFNVRGYDRGRPLSDLTHKLGYAELQADADAVLARLAPIEREVRDDAGRWYLARVLPYRSVSDRIDGVVITFVETTAMKQVEEALRQSEERASDELAVMVRLHELTDRLLACTDLEEALAEVLDATIAITRADQGSVQLLDAGGELEMVVQRGLGPDGVQSLAAGMDQGGSRSTPLVSHDGSPLGALNTHYAAPYRPSQRETRILDLYSRQATHFIERVRNLEVLNEKRRLQVEDERKAYFLAALGHELRDPLATLDTAMKLIEEGAREATDLYPLVSAQIEHLKRLVNDLLEISRISRGAITLRKARVDLVQIVRRAAETVASHLEGKEQRLVLPAIETLPIHADGTRLEQVIANLLHNASKYSPAKSPIEVALRREGENAVVVVRDEGRGLRREDLRRIFDAYAQAHPIEGGLGIGLSLVKRLVELHDGSITVESEGPNRGSVFTVLLPIGDVEAAVEPAPRPPAKPVPAARLSTRVLIADDAEESAEALAVLLRLRGADVCCAFTGGEALEAARLFRPRVALIDIRLPDMTGYDVARGILELGGEGVLLVAITGFSDSLTEERARTAGFNERLVKPLDLRKLYELIREHIERVG